jgi:endonuclease/exonuclease/phosphatase family metal-dependent hydrolase
MTSDAPRRPVFRVMTYNVHPCIGADGHLSPYQIAEVISRCRPDIVALQELDVGRVRTGNLHQAEAIAQQLEMRFVYATAIAAPMITTICSWPHRASFLPRRR